MRRGIGEHKNIYISRRVESRIRSKKRRLFRGQVTNTGPDGRVWNLISVTTRSDRSDPIKDRAHGKAERERERDSWDLSSPWIDLFKGVYIRPRIQWRDDTMLGTRREREGERHGRRRYKGRDTYTRGDDERDGALDRARTRWRFMTDICGQF